MKLYQMVRTILESVHECGRGGLVVVLRTSNKFDRFLQITPEDHFPYDELRNSSKWRRPIRVLMRTLPKSFALGGGGWTQ